MGLLAFVIILFFDLIPVNIFESASMFFCFLGGACVFLCLFMALGRFESLYDIFNKPEADDPEPPATRKYAPYAFAPALITVFVLLFWQIERKSTELEKNGRLTKGRVVGGFSRSTTRRMHTSTTYTIRVSYVDSLQREHFLEDDVNSGEFNDLYEGAVIDLVYSKRYPDLAKPVLDVEELTKYRKVPMNNLAINDLLTIYNGGVTSDSVLAFLNTINYEWHVTEGGAYVNERLQMAVRLVDGQLIYLQQSDMLKGYSENDFSFEKNMIDQGFQKKAAELNGETLEMFYKDDYIITKERQRDDSDGSSMSFNYIDIFRLSKQSVAVN